MRQEPVRKSVMQNRPQQPVIIYVKYTLQTALGQAPEDYTTAQAQGSVF